MRMSRRCLMEEFRETHLSVWSLHFWTGIAWFKCKKFSEMLFVMPPLLARLRTAFRTGRSKAGWKSLRPTFADLKLTVSFSVSCNHLRFFRQQISNDFLHKQVVVGFSYKHVNPHNVKRHRVMCQFQTWFEVGFGRCKFAFGSVFLSGSTLWFFEPIRTIPCY